MPDMQEHLGFPAGMQLPTGDLAYALQTAFGFPSLADVGCLPICDASHKYHCGLFGDCYRGPDINAKQIACTRRVIAKDGLGIALDLAGTVAGLVPGAGAALVTTQTALGLASAANSAISGNVISTVAGAGGAKLSALAGGASYVGWRTAAKVIPWVGTAVNVISTGMDIAGAWSDYQACMAGRL